MGKTIVDFIARLDKEPIHDKLVLTVLPAESPFFPGITIWIIRKRIIESKPMP